MKILFLTPNFPPEVNAAASRTFEHCRRWVEAGHQVTVIAPAPNWPRGQVYEGYENVWRREEEIHGIRVVRIWTLMHPNKGIAGRTLSFLTFMVRAIWETLRERRGADVLLATSPHFFSGQAGMLARWLTGLPFVLEIRDIWPESVVAVGAVKQSFVLRVAEWLEHCMYRSADHIVTVGEGYREKLLERGVAPESITVVPNGVDLNRWRPQSASSELRQKWRGDGRFICTYVGTVGMAHGLDVVVRAARRLKAQGRTDIVFWIVGDGARRQEIEDQVAREHLDIVVTGQVSKSEVATIVATSDACLVHLRSTELFGTVIPSKIFEILAMETPIIMGVRGQALEIVLEAEGGTPMTPEDEASLLDGIESIRNAPQAHNRGRRFVAGRFNRDDTAAQMLETVGRVADCEPAPAPVAHPMERRAA